MKVLGCFFVVLLLSSIVAAEVSLETRVEPNTVCQGESTLLFIDLENDRTTTEQDSLLRISSQSLLNVSEEIDIAPGKTRRMFQFSGAVGNHVIITSVDDVSDAATLYVVSCGGASGAPVLIVPQIPQEEENLYFIGSVVGIYLVGLLIICVVIFAWVQRNR